MRMEQPGQTGLDYQTVSYPGSMVEFRGPPADLTLARVVCLGGSETFGRFVEHPFSEILSMHLDTPVANLGALNAGVELMLHDPAINMALATADHVVLQVTGAHLMTNRFYRVHPRRNDRFLRASAALSTVYRGTDFTDFHFVRHMLSVLAANSPERFNIVARELQEAWVGRMLAILDRVEAPVHLLWMSRDAPSATAAGLESGGDPLFVTEQMIDQISGRVASVSTCPATDAEQDNPTFGMIFDPAEGEAARLLPGPAQHDRVARMLADQIGT